MAVALVTHIESNAPNTSPISGNETIGAASTLMIVAYAAAALSTNIAVPTSVTWNGVTLAALSNKTESDNLGNIYLFGMVNPATGTHNLTINFTPATGSSPGSYFSIITFSGTDTSAIGTAVPAANILTDASTPSGTTYPTTAFSVTTANGDAAFAAMNSENQQFTTMATGTLLDTDGTGTGNFTDGYSLAVGATTTLQFGSGASGNPACSIAIRIQQPQTGVTFFGFLDFVLPKGHWVKEMIRHD